ncbi:hypothetical protein Acr_00g0077880 [Actinidia rufa]|uniref:Subtilisin-like protease fibronectin type-III domain-containing protein n=1 Tax=Actinidia rufa TaxID=165716 RepID=A0A7J0DTY6_9ERIC|nr:hypothetical protein Acr_00g0077880 [Actinidia rufa]
MNAANHPSAEFGYGAGHNDPAKVANPGLVHETFKQDYVKMFCDLSYDSGKLRDIVGDNSSCPVGPIGSPAELNYPSMTNLAKPTSPFNVKFPRTVMNVGLANSAYKALVTKIEPVRTNVDLNISVDPSILSFESLNEKKSFVMTEHGAGLQANESVSAWLVWSDCTA